MIYGMITTKASDAYTKLALKSFFNNTQLNDDLFYLIDNDNTNTDIENVIVIHNTAPKSFAENVNTIIDIANGEDIIMLNNDIIFTPNWVEPLKKHNGKVLIPACNQTKTHSFGKLNILPTMSIEQFDGHYDDLNKIANFHCKTTKPKLFETLLMPFYAFVLPASVYNMIGMFDTSYGKGGAEDVDYRIRCLMHDIPVLYTNESYLLHFHGKSTWDGAETPVDIELRGKLYYDRFVELWGIDLAELLLIRDVRTIIDKHNLQEYVLSAEYTKLIKNLLDKL